MSQNHISFPYSTQEIRVVIKDDEPWFVVSDVCKILDIKNPTQATDRLDDDERSMFNIGRQGEVNIISESGLYDLILSSRKKEAKDFKRWVRKDVLPSIRKTGSYTNQNHQAQPPEQNQSYEKINRQQLDQIERLVHEISMCCHHQTSASWNVYAGIRETHGLNNGIQDLPATQFTAVYGLLNVINEKARQYLNMRVAIDKQFCKDVLRKHQLRLDISQQFSLLELPA